MLETRLTRLFGIKYPIICGGLQWIGRAELIAAIANAGGLGFLTAATFEDLEELRAEIRKARDLTDGPIGLNINLFPAARPQPIEAWVEMAIDEKIPVVETAGRSPEAIVGPLHDGGVKIMHKVVGVRYASTAERLGCDAVCVVGFEGGGHPGIDQVTTLVLVPATVDAVEIPVVAAGGFADGRGLMAALALGADAVLFGTRFVATQECRGHATWKQRLSEASAGDSVLILRSIGNPMRVLKNAVADKVMEMESQGATLDELLPVIGGRPGPLWDEGNLDGGLAAAGQAVELIRDVPTVKELIDRMLEQALEVQERLNGIAAAP